MKQHCIILHIYYTDLWNEFESLLTPILNDRDDIDLYVTLCEEDTSIKEDILKITNNLFILPNKGLDIGPFLYVLNEISSKDYISITKLHSKKSLSSRQSDFVKYWREILTKSLIGNIDIYNDNINMIEKKPLSMIGSDIYLFNYIKDSPNIPFHLKMIEETINDLNINISIKIIDNKACFSSHGLFFAGTIFMTSHYYLKELFRNIDLIDFYNNLPNGYVRNSKSHALERIFGWYLTELGGDILIRNNY